MTATVTAVKTPVRRVSPPGVPLPASAMSGISAAVYIANLPDDPGGQGIAGYTPQLRELVDDALPLVTYLLKRQDIGASLPVFFFFINSRLSLAENAVALTAFLHTLNGQQAAWVPLSANHTALLHTLRMVLPEYAERQMKGLHLLYIGDNANRASMAAVAESCAMPFAYHALY